MVSALVLLIGGCAGLFFYPWSQHVRTPDQIGLGYEDVWFETDDGLRLHGWYLPARGNPCASVLFLHGNAENISTHIASVHWMPGRGFDVFMPDYRGYGASAGAPSLAGLQRDVEAAMRILLARRRGADQVAVFGQSLGAATAIHYVARSPHRARIGALVVESPFASHRAIAREKLAEFWLTWPFQWIPRLTVSDAYSPAAAIGDVAPIPLLIVHGERDRIVPIAHAERLYAAAREPKQLWRAEGGHIAAFRSEPMRERLAAYLAQRLCPDRSRRTHERR